MTFQLVSSSNDLSTTVFSFVDLSANTLFLTSGPSPTVFSTSVSSTTFC